MSKQHAVSLQQLKTQMATEEQKRTAIQEQGARAYWLGIERHNCPLKELSEQNLWKIGYDKSKKEFETTFSRRVLSEKDR
jgi:hypothetical protein